MLIAGFFSRNSGLLPFLISFLLFDGHLTLRSIPVSVRNHRKHLVLHSVAPGGIFRGFLLDEIPVEILDLLHDRYKGPQGLQNLFPDIFSSLRTIGTALREGAFTADKTGTENPFGDQQLDVDIKADKVTFGHVMMKSRIGIDSAGIRDIKCHHVALHT